MKSSTFNKGFSEKIVREKLATRSDIKRRFETLEMEYDLERERLSSSWRGSQEKIADYQEERQKRQQAWIEEVKRNLSENEWPLHLVHELARVYFGLVAEVTESIPID